MKVSVRRWLINDRIVAYSYGLIPVTAHQDKGKWIIDSEAACVFDVTFIDDEGDGIFRVMVHGPSATSSSLAGEGEGGLS